MSIWNKVLVGLIFIVSVAFAYAAARTLKTQEVWHAAAVKYEKSLAEARRASAEALDGANGRLGIRRARIELHKQLINRGRVWRNCTPQKANAQTGEAAVVIEKPQPHGLTAKTVLYIFDANDVEKGGRYLGEFSVSAVAEKQIGLQPTHKMSERQLQQLGASRGPWNLYDVMPIDSHDAFAGKSPEDLRKLLVEESVAEHARDGKKADPSDPAECVDKKGNYVRPLRDYQAMFGRYYRELARNAELEGVVARAKKSLAAAEANIKRSMEASQTTIEAAKTELAAATAQRDAVAGHRKQLEENLAAAKQWIEQTLASNRVMAKEITKLQLEASRRIDLRTRSMAQAQLSTQN